MIIPATMSQHDSGTINAWVGNRVMPSLAILAMKTHDAIMNGIVTLGKFGLTTDNLGLVLLILLGISGLIVEKLESTSLSVVKSPASVVVENTSKSVGTNVGVGK